MSVSVQVTFYDISSNALYTVIVQATLNILVCSSDIYWCVTVTYIYERQCVYVRARVCDCGLPLALFQVQFRVLASYKSQTTDSESLSGDAELAAQTRCPRLYT